MHHMTEKKTFWLTTDIVEQPNLFSTYDYFIMHLKVPDSVEMSEQYLADHVISTWLLPWFWKTLPL